MIDNQAENAQRLEREKMMQKSQTARSLGEDLRKMVEDKRSEEAVTNRIRELELGIA